MDLPKEAIEEFQALMKQEYNQNYTLAEAGEASKNLLSFISCLIEINKTNL